MSSEARDKQDPLQSLIAEILDAENRGEVIDREAYLAEHPDHAQSLRDFFASHDQMKSAAEADPPTLPPKTTEPTFDDPTLPPTPTSFEDPTIPPTAPSGEDPTLAPTDGVAIAKEPAVGDQVRYFGDYELLEEIARGGMGVVFKARQINLNRIVALKMILAGQFAGEEDVQRFYTEAEAAAQLDHPGIVPIFEIGEYQNQHYFSMGYIEGESLAQKVADGPLPPRDAAELVVKICDAMAYAHERGVIHRDLKPANILVDANGQPKVTDFGLAKRTEADSNLTGTGQILGTPAYMPPEQASGKTEVGPLADVYSLGAILYCLLTGRPPFQAASPMDTLLQVLDQEPVAPATLNRQVPKDLDTICLKCLSKEVERRYESAEELGRDVRRFLNGEPIQARRVGRRERTIKWIRRHKVVTTLSAALVSAIIAGSLGAMWFGTSASTQRRLAEQRQYARDIQSARSFLDNGEIQAAWEVLEKTPLDSSGWEYDYLRSASTWESISTPLKRPAHPYFSNEKRAIAIESRVTERLTGRKRIKIHQLDPETGELIETIDVGEDCYGSVISPDGRWLLIEGVDQQSYLWSVASRGSDGANLPDGWGFMRFSMHTPDRLLLRATGTDVSKTRTQATEFAIWDIGDETPTQTWTAPGKFVCYHGPSQTMATIEDDNLVIRANDGSTQIFKDARWELHGSFTPKADKLLIAAEKTRSSPIERFVSVIDLQSGEIERTVPVELSLEGSLMVKELISGVTTDPHGRLAFVNTSENGFVFDIESGREMCVTPNADHGQFSSDGENLITGGESGIRIYRVNRNASLAISRVDGDFSLHPDGELLAVGRSGSRLCEVIDLANGLEPAKSFDASGDYIMFSPNGRWLAVGGGKVAEGRIAVWDTKSWSALPPITFDSTSRGLGFAGDTLFGIGLRGQVFAWNLPYGHDARRLPPERIKVARLEAGGPTGCPLIASDGRYYDVIKPRWQGQYFENPGVFAPVTRQFVTGSQSGRVKIHDLDQPSYERLIGTHDVPVSAVAISPDESRIVSGDADGGIKIWDADTGVELLTLNEHDSAILKITFSLNGTVMCSRDQSQILKVRRVFESVRRDRDP